MYQQKIFYKISIKYFPTTVAAISKHFFTLISCSVKVDSYIASCYSQFSIVHVPIHDHVAI